MRDDEHLFKKHQVLSRETSQIDPGGLLFASGGPLSTPKAPLLAHSRPQTYPRVLLEPFGDPQTGARGGLARHGRAEPEPRDGRGGVLQ